MKEIRLSKGQVALIDDEDYERVMQFKWCWNGRYAIRNVHDGKHTHIVKLHRFVMNAQPGQEVDHINHDGRDCRRSVNLRICTRSENMQNRRKLAPASSHYHGVDWNKQRGMWRARCQANGQYVHVGYFASEEAAAWKRDEKARQLQGQFAVMNFGE